MYGFKSSHARPQNLADGGIVDSVVAGAKRIAHLVSLGHGKKPDPAPQQPPQQVQAQPAVQKPQEQPQNAISQYSGNSALKRREAEAGLKDGGPVRGPGTGISDSIETEVPAGSYIMPADSTKQVGLGFKPKDVPVNLSNGEFQLSPEQVQKIGSAVLDVVKGVTHTPAAEQDAMGMDDSSPGEIEGAPGDAAEDMAEGENEGADPRGNMFFADGGQVGGFLPRMRTSGSGWRTDSVLAGTGEDVADQVRKGNYGQAAGTLVRGTAAAVPAAAADVVQDLTDNPITQGAAGFVRGVFGSDGAPANSPAPSPAAKPAAPAPSAQATTASPARPVQQASSAQSPVSTPAQPAANNVTRAGSSYSGKDISGDFTINGQSPGGGFAVTPAQAAGSVSQPAVPVQQAGGPTFASISAPRRNGDREAVMSAALTPMRGARGITANQLRTAQGLIEGDQRDATQRYTADQQAATQRDVTGMNNDASLVRTGMTESGANSRAAAGNAIQQGDLRLRQEAQGFKTREAQRTESLYAKYDAAKTPEERSAIAQQIRDLSGRESQNRFTVAPGGQEIDPTTQQLVTRPSRIFNNQTGQFVDQQQSQQAAPSRPVGTRSVVGGKTAVWDGKQWIPQ